jgi:hypothetical protein
VAVVAHALRHQDVLATIKERVRFARRRFGRYDLVDFVVVLLSYAVSGGGGPTGWQYGTVQCPAGFPLYPQERRPERDGSVRVVYAARIGHCRPCPRREECQGYGSG